ncbi:MAG: hypothetical protein ACK5JM_02240 [Rhodoblastus sp.]
MMAQAQNDISSPAIPRFFGSWALAALIVVAAIAQQAAGHLNGDDSWFILFAEKVAGGARAYVDISDPNPPAGFLVYMPAVYLARLFGLDTEFWTVVQTFVLVFASLALSGAILSRCGLIAREERGVTRNAALWLLLFSVGFAFAEREHFALIAFLPFAAAALSRAEAQDGKGAGLSTLRLIAGLCGGIVLCFKPYFALPLGAVVLFACVRRRSLAPLFAPENLVLAATAIAYGVLVWLRYPDYVWGQAGLAMEVYAPARYGLAAVLTSTSFVFSAALLIGVAAGLYFLGFEPRAALLGLASAGFLATYVIQAKNWFNHAYPGEALGVLACVALALGRFGARPEASARFSRFAVLPALLLAPFLCAVQLNVLRMEEYPGLTAAVTKVLAERAQGAGKPKIAALAHQLDVGQPLTRQLNADWVGRRNALWVDNCVRQILASKTVDDEMRRRLLEYSAGERREFAEDMAQGKPDILLVETPQLATWAARQPEFVGMLDGYTKKTQVGDIEIFARNGT